MADSILLPICLNCNLEVARGWNKYCSRKCHRDYRRSALSRACEACGIRFTPISFRTNIHGASRPAPNKQRTTCSPQCNRALISKQVAKLTGARKGNWKGGVSAEHNHGFRGINWPAIASKIRERDGHSCTECGLTSDEHRERYGKALEVHHVIPFHNFTDHVKANRPANLKTLCVPCHRTADANVPAAQLSLTWSDRPRGNRSGLARGEKHGSAVLTSDSVIRMRKRHSGGASVYRIAKDEGVAYMTAKHAIKGLTWKHLPLN